MHNLHALRRLLATLIVPLPLLFACAATEPEANWPSKLVGIDRMKTTTPIKTSLLVNRMSGSPAATVVLRVHVDEAGDVVRAMVLESNGTPRVDGAALGAMRKMKFVPYVENGVAVPVSVIAPLHFPALN